MESLTVTKEKEECKSAKEKTLHIRCADQLTNKNSRVTATQGRINEPTSTEKGTNNRIDIAPSIQSVGSEVVTKVNINKEPPDNRLEDRKLNHGQQIKGATNIGQVTRKNKNAVLRRSKSFLGLQTNRNESIPHSNTYAGDTLTSLGSQTSIPEADTVHNEEVSQTQPTHSTQQSQQKLNQIQTPQQQHQQQDQSQQYQQKELNDPGHDQLQQKRRQQSQQQEFSQFLQQPLPERSEQSQLQDLSKLQLQQDQSQQSHQQIESNALKQQVQHEQTQQSQQQRPSQSEEQQTQQERSQQNQQQKQSKPHRSKLEQEEPRQSQQEELNIPCEQQQARDESYQQSQQQADHHCCQQQHLQEQNQTHTHTYHQHQLLHGCVNKDERFTLKLQSPFQNAHKDSYSTLLQRNWKNTRVTSFEDDESFSDQSEENETSTSCSAGTTTNNTAQLSISSSFASVTGQLKEEASWCSSSSQSSEHAETLPATLKAFNPYGVDAQPSGTQSQEVLECKQELLSSSNNMSVLSSPSVDVISPEVDYVSLSLTSVRSSLTLNTLTSQAPPSALSTQATSTPTNSSAAVLGSEDSYLQRDKRRDFVLLYPDGDQEEALAYVDHLMKDIGTHNLRDLTVDLFSEIDSGLTDMRSAESLHDKYNNILIFVSNNSKKDNFSRFLHENILTTGLRDANGKEDRVIPVWTSCGISIFEFQSIKGFAYYRYKSADPNSKSAKSYIECVQNTIHRGRRRNPRN